MSARKHKLSKKGKARLAGYTILGLAVLGVAFLVFLGTKGVQFLLDDSDKRLEYQKFIEPVVIVETEDEESGYITQITVMQIEKKK